MIDRDFIDRMSTNQLKLLYSNINQSYVILDGVFSDESRYFVSPNEPNTNEPITIKLRTAKDNIDAINIVSGDTSIKMVKAYNEGLFDYYKATINGITETFNYHFQLEKDDQIYYYNKNGLHDYLDKFYNFKIIPNFKTPEWSKGAVMYQIYVDRFYNGDPTNDVKKFEYMYLGKPVTSANWNDPVTNDDVWTFYGGDLQGVIDKLDYLKDLGVDAIYFNPIFVAPSNHKYDAQDYDHVDPHIGVIKNDEGEILKFEHFDNDHSTKYMSRTINQENLDLSNQLAITLIEKAHEKGLKVILDGVFNHCGAFNKWLDTAKFYKHSGAKEDGAYISENSKYHDYFNWLGGEWPDNMSYDGWWGHSNHPKLFFEQSKELEEYILNIGRKWVSPPYNADGWRLDVAADLGMSPEYNHYFWQKFKESVKEANSETIIIAEHYGDPTEWLKGDQWDTIMNYDAFMEPLTWFLTGMEKHSEEFRGDLLSNSTSFINAMKYHMAKMPIQSLMTSMNQLSNHDHSRFLTRTNMTAGRLNSRGSEAADTGINLGIMYEAIVFQATWIGAPTLYYGDEAAVTGWTDPDNRRTFPWESLKSGIARDVHRFYKLAIRLHKDYKCLCNGSIKVLYHNYGIVSYARFTDNQRIIVILNNNNQSRKIAIPVWQLGVKNNSVFSTVLESSKNYFNTPTYKYFIKKGHIEITVNGFGSVVLVEK